MSSPRSRNSRQDSLLGPPLTPPFLISFYQRDKAGQMQKKRERERERRKPNKQKRTGPPALALPPLPYTLAALLEVWYLLAAPVKTGHLHSLEFLVATGVPEGHIHGCCSWWEVPAYRIPVGPLAGCRVKRREIGWNRQVRATESGSTSYPSPVLPLTLPGQAGRSKWVWETSL